uniref:Dual adaptor of phosphotyrosine and 3-phosphoinositides 1 n=1 Tax=Calidris pygmaea TaxID=425635 RepID=A0A8C3JCV3_9CHAR
MHFANQPLIGSETGTLIVLKHPYPREVEEPSIYESVRVHTAMQTGRTESDLVPNAPSLGTKEGYLIKQGKIVKNWKTRWFTLHRNELKYFKDQTATEPIRALDLTECSAVQFDYSQERVNCFCLVFPLRTYYLCAKTGIEADEWIKILRWKLALPGGLQRSRGKAAHRSQWRLQGSSGSSGDGGYSTRGFCLPVARSRYDQASSSTTDCTPSTRFRQLGSQYVFKLRLQEFVY